MVASIKFLEHFVSLPKTKKTFTSVTGRTFERVEADIPQLSQMLTCQGFDVEGVETVGDKFDSVVVGRIVSATRHPNADKLQVCMVDVGEASPRQIVCGAPNARTDIYVAVALPGTKMPSGMEIKLSTIREVQSSGMLCSREELGLPLLPAIDGKGIWEITSEAQGGQPVTVLADRLGIPLFDALELRDTLLELNITPNRPDVRCHEGLAREIAAGFAYRGIPYEWKSAPADSVEKLFGAGADHAKATKVLFDTVVQHAQVKTNEEIFAAENHLGQPAFFILLKNVKVGTSPAWLRNLLEGLGQNSVNNIVDASNYILLAYGQPNHAFDLSKIATDKDGIKRIFLRNAKTGERFVGLDGRERELDPRDCVVADANGAQALLGVIGGEQTKVDEKTDTIVIEIANPHPVAVRRTSRRHGRSTDASMAFEKGIDTVARWHSAVRLCCMIDQVSEHQTALVGAVHSTLCEQDKVTQLKCIDTNYSAPDKKYEIEFDATAEKRIIGAAIVPWPKQLTILRSLGFGVLENGSTAKVQTPHWRWLDVFGVQDLVEEITRINGIDNVPEVPLNQGGQPVADDSHFPLFESMSARAAVLGYHEVSDFHFMGTQDLQKLGMPSMCYLGEPVALMNPIFKDEPLMQTSLIPGLLKKVALNVNYGRDRGQLYHVARTYQNLSANGQRFFSDNGTAMNLAAHLTEPSAKRLNEYAPEAAHCFTQEKSGTLRPSETPRIAGIAFGNRVEKHWQNTGALPWDLHTVMSHCMELTRIYGVEVKVERLSDCHPFALALHPGKSVAFHLQLTDGDAVEIGWAGFLRPKSLRAYEITVPAVAFELNLALLHRCRNTAVRKKSGLIPQKFPTVSRDFSFLLDSKITGAEIVNTIKEAMIPVTKDLTASCSDVQIFDIYTGKGVPEEKKSVAFNVKFVPEERTFTDADIQKITVAVASAMLRRFGAELRG